MRQEEEGAMGGPGIVLSEARHIKMADIMQIPGIFKQFKFGLLSVSIRLKLTPFAGVSLSLYLSLFLSYLSHGFIYAVRALGSVAKGVKY